MLSKSLIRNSLIESMVSTMYGVFCLLLSRASMTPNVKYRKHIFNVQSIEAGPMMIAYKMTKLFSFFIDQLNVDVLQLISNLS